MSPRDSSSCCPAFSILEAEAGGLLAMYEIEQESFSSGYDIYSLRQFLDLFQGLIFVAKAEEEVIGWALCATEARNRERAWFLSLAVKKHWRRRGVGRALALRSLEALREMRVKECRTTCRDDNEASLRLHYEFGCKRESYQEDYYGPGESRLVMLLRL